MSAHVYLMLKVSTLQIIGLRKVCKTCLKILTDGLIRKIKCRRCLNKFFLGLTHANR
jgi:hypothetical protein